MPTKRVRPKRCCGRRRRPGANGGRTLLRVAEEFPRRRQCAASSALESRQRIALIGPLADDSAERAWILGWTGSRRGCDLLPRGTRETRGEQNLVHLKGVGITDGSDEDLAAAVAAAGESRPRHPDAGGEWRGHDGRGHVAGPSRIARASTGAARKNRRDWQAGRSRPVQRTSPDASLGVRARSGRAGRVASRHPGGARARAHAVWRVQSHRQARRQLASHRGTGTALLQRAQHGPPGRQERSDNPPATASTRMFRATSTSATIRNFPSASDSPTPRSATARPRSTRDLQGFRADAQLSDTRPDRRV